MRGKTKLTIILLVIMIQIIYLNIGYVWASTPLYYYDKYNVVIDVWWETSPVYEVGWQRRSEYGLSRWSFDTKTGEFNAFEYSTHCNNYSVSNNNRTLTWNQEGDESDPKLKLVVKMNAIRMTSQNKGSLIGTIVGSATEYPLNGVHADGFWYVRKEYATMAPLINLTQPSANSPLQAINTMATGVA